MEVVPSATSVTQRRVSFPIDIPGNITPEFSTISLSTKDYHPQDSVQINDLGFNKAHSASSCAAAVDYHIMSTFASLLPSLQLAFFSKPNAEEEEAKVSTVPGANDSTDPAAPQVIDAIDGTPTASRRPVNLRQSSSTSSDQRAGTGLEAQNQSPGEGFIWKDGERVRYDADGNARRRKDGKARSKEKQRPETEVRQSWPGYMSSELTACSRRPS